MKQKNFHFWMHAVDDDLLEEAMQPVGRHRGWIRITAGLAACLVLAALGRRLVFPGADGNSSAEPAAPQAVMFCEPGEHTEQYQYGAAEEGGTAAAAAENFGAPVTDPAENAAAAAKMVNPVSSADREALTELGYRIPLPEGASEAEWSLIRTGGAVPMGQVDFSLEGTAYTFRALQDTEPQDISGIYDLWDQELQWQDGSLQLQLCTGETGQGWIGWYDAELRTQWCLSSLDHEPALTETARILLENLGYGLTAAPTEP